jgi:hypothetical protein
MNMPGIVQNELVFKCASCGMEVKVPCLESAWMPVAYSPYRVKGGKAYCDKCWNELK